MSGPVDILVYGLGAVGSLYSYNLSCSEEVRLTVVARSNYEAVKQNGITLKSKVHGDHTFHPHAVVKSISEATGPFEYVMLAHKALGTEVVPAGLSAAINPESSLVIMQNGVGNEDPFRRELPDNTIISCALWISAHQTSPGVIQHFATVNTPIGLFPNPSIAEPVENERLVKFAGLLKRGGTPVEVVSSSVMQIRRWEKCVWNAAFNSLTALTQLDTQSWLRSSPESVSITRKLMIEIATVARSCGVDVEEGIEERLLKQVLGLPGIVSSMQVDVREGRVLEVEIIFGEPLRRGREKGLATPILEVIYALLTGINGKLSSGEATE